MPRYRLTMYMEAENEEELELEFNENIPEFEDFRIDEISDDE